MGAPVQKEGLDDRRESWGRVHEKGRWDGAGLEGWVGYGKALEHLIQFHIQSRPH